MHEKTCEKTWRKHGGENTKTWDHTKNMGLKNMGSKNMGSRVKKHAQKTHAKNMGSCEKHGVKSQYCSFKNKSKEKT